MWRVAVSQMGLLALIRLLLMVSFSSAFIINRRRLANDDPDVDWVLSMATKIKGDHISEVMCLGINFTTSVQSTSNTVGSTTVFLLGHTFEKSSVASRQLASLFSARTIIPSQPILLVLLISPDCNDAYLGRWPKESFSPSLFSSLDYAQVSTNG
jgi:hypothetical protein